MRLISALLLALLSLNSSLTSLQAETSKTAIRFVPPPPPNRGAPTGRSKGGASRTGTCQVTDRPLTALIPVTEDRSSKGQPTTSETVWALTVSDYPTFWYYVPYALNADSPIEFVLQDERQNTLYKKTMTVSSANPGIMKVTLPKTIAPLENGKMYHWYFLVYCDANDPIFVEGWIERITLNPTFKRQLQQAKPIEQVALLAANGIWYDALTQLAKLRQTYPQEWQSLLKSVGLEAISSEPILEL